MNKLSAFIVGFPVPVLLSTTNAPSAFVVVTKEPPVTKGLLLSSEHGRFEVISSEKPLGK